LLALQGDQDPYHGTGFVRGRNRPSGKPPIWQKPLPGAVRFAESRSVENGVNVEMIVGKKIIGCCAKNANYCYISNFFLIDSGSGELSGYILLSSVKNTYVYG
jgi:hypothetical protein